MPDWLQFQERTNLVTGEKTISYSHTPEEFVVELHKRNECIYVSKGSCPECIYTPENLVPQKEVRKMNAESLAQHRMPECTLLSIAHYQRRVDVPGFVLCYGFYYQYWNQNKYLLAAKEAGLITFYDVAHLPGSQETGLRSIGFY